jgi:hypothetical protein
MGFILLGFIAFGSVAAAILVARRPPRVFWPCLGGGLGFLLGFILATPLGCTTSMSVPGGSSRTECASILPFHYEGPTPYSPSYWPPLIVGMALALIVASLITLIPQVRVSRERPRERRSSHGIPARLLWLLAGALAGFSFLAIFSFGMLGMCLDAALVSVLIHRKLRGGEMFLVGLGLFIAPFAISLLGPECVSGSGTCTVGGRCVERCLEYRHAGPYEYGYVIGSLAFVALGTAVSLMRRRRQRTQSPVDTRLSR